MAIEILVAAFMGTLLAHFLMWLINKKSPKEWSHKWKCPKNGCGFLLETDSATFRTIIREHEYQHHAHLN